MRVNETESRLREMLADAERGSSDNPQGAARAAWDAFKAFAAEPVDIPGGDPDSDMVLNEWGPNEWSSRPPTWISSARRSTARSRASARRASRATASALRCAR